MKAQHKVNGNTQCALRPEELANEIGIEPVLPISQ